MKIYPINSGHFKLDGGAMFGVVPKTMWNSLNPADEKNMCSWAMRCMLVESGNRLVLIDNGLGDKQDEKFFGYYYLHGEDSLEKSLVKYGFHYEDITDVFLTHLHFDHCGGSVKYNKEKTGFELVFKNATYWSNKEHWEWATKPNAREKASFLKENILPIEESGHLKFLEKGQKLSNEFDVMTVSGHTESMMIPLIQYKGKTVAFMADLIPSAGHIPVPYVMAYDTRPLLTLDEKTEFLNLAADQEYVLFFEHDPILECCTVEKTERGFRIKEKFSFEEYFGR